ncbi:hypothetical protein IE077_002707, partial [Cardiosporidium cionae]
FWFFNLFPPVVFGGFVDLIFELAISERVLSWLLNSTGWASKKLSPKIQDSQKDPSLASERETGVVISSLFKIYRQSGGDVVKALNNFELTIHANETMVLLGENGAGKSTLMKILSGEISPTNGSISIFGMDLHRDKDKIHQIIGVCPQHDALWDKLTVYDHMELFARLKNSELKGPILKENIRNVLCDVNLLDKMDVYPRKLSGGMRRKISIALAFICNPKLVLLDEPSSGLDPFSRQLLWKVLQDMKARKSVLISTHYTDEAEVLGDRVAIVHKGSTICCGSAFDLKNHYDCEEAKLDSSIEEVMNFDANSNLTECFLQNKYSVGWIKKCFSQMQAIFLKLYPSISMDATALSRSQVGGSRKLNAFPVFSQSEADNKEIKEFVPNESFLWNSVSILPIKNVPVNASNKLIPTTYFNLRGFDEKLYALFRNNSLNYIEEKRTYPDEYIGAFTFFAPEPTRAAAETKNALPITEARFNKDSYIFQVRGATHTPGILMQEYMRLLVKKNGFNYTTKFINSPLNNPTNSSISRLGQSFAQIQAIALLLCLLPLFLVPWITYERKHQIKHLQFLNGLNPVIYWVVNFTVDFIQVLFSLMLCVLALYLLNYPVISTYAYISVIMELLVVSGFAFIPLVYVICFISGETSSNQLILFVLNVILAFVAAFAAFFTTLPGVYEDEENVKKIGVAIRMFGNFIPAFNSCEALLNIAFSSGFNRSEFERTESYKQDFNWLFYDALLYSGLLFLLESYHIFGLQIMFFLGLRKNAKPLNRLASPNKTPSIALTSPLQQQPSMIGFGRGPVEIPPMVETSHLRKEYKSFFHYLFCHGSDKVALKDLSFQSFPGDIITLVGANGAGKSSLMSTLSGATNPTSGYCYVNSYSMDTSPLQYLHSIGSCPQFSALWDNLTVFQHLSLFANIQGYTHRGLKSIILQQLAHFGILKYAHTRAGHLSGGTQRKLSVLISLLGWRHLILLDEPSTGLDPLSRRRLVKFLSEWTRQAKTLPVMMISTHAFEEAEDIADQLLLLGEGERYYYGSLSALKEKYSQIFELSLKLPEPTHEEIDQCLIQFDLLLDSSIPFTMAEQMFVTQSNKLPPSLTQDSSEGLLFSKAWLRFSSRNIPTPLFIRWWILRCKVLHLVDLLKKEQYDLEVTECNDLLFKFSIFCVEDVNVFKLFQIFDDEDFLATIGFSVSDFSFSTASLNQLITLVAAEKESLKLSRSMNAASAVLHAAGGGPGLANASGYPQSNVNPSGYP